MRTAQTTVLQTIAQRYASGVNRSQTRERRRLLNCLKPLAQLRSIALIYYSDTSQDVPINGANMQTYAARARSGPGQG